MVMSMRYLGLDLGTKTLGISISKTGIISNPYTLLRYNNEDYDYLSKEVKKIIEKENIDVVVLGLPKNMDNTCGFAATRSLDFKKELENYINIPIKLVDERLSTVEAEHILISQDMSRKKRKDYIDMTASMIILDTYLKGKSKNEE